MATQLFWQGAYTKGLKAAVLRDVMDGKIHHVPWHEADFGIVFEKGEEVAWVFKTVSLLEHKTLKHYEGTSSGISIRVMKGVYYRVGAFKGQPVETDVCDTVDSGSLVFTNQAIHFAGTAQKFRLLYKKIESFQAFSDGIGITRDGMNAKEQLFVTGDGWFSYNLAMNLSRLGK